MSTLGNLILIGMAVYIGLCAYLWLATDGGFRPLEALSVWLGLVLDFAFLAAKEDQALASRYGGSVSAPGMWMLNHASLVIPVAYLLIGAGMWDKYRRWKEERSATKPDDVPELEAGPDSKGDADA